ncbi:MAG: hypothetical protein ACFFC5_04175, partial [Promethearchaeota archaeon]
TAVFTWSNPENLEGIIELWGEYPGNRTHTPSTTDICSIELVTLNSDNVLLMISLGASSSFIALGVTLTVARRRIGSMFGK